jgi:hypothetical protein
MASTQQANRPPLRELRLPDEIIGHGGKSIALRWVLSRALTLAIMSFFHEADVSGDVQYYARSLHQMFSGGSIQDTLQEYPLPVFGVLLPQFLLGFLNQVAFTILFVLSMLLVDATFARLLWRADGRHRGDATNLWLWFVPAIGPLAYFRFDLVPAVLAGGAVLVAIRRPAVAGALTALGAGLKLWPVVMLPTFLIRRRDRRPVLVGFAVTGLLLIGVSIAIAGVRRMISPLHWQSARGLQIESVPAAPLMVARAFDHNRWTLAISRYQAWEIFGPNVSAMVRLSSVLTVLGGIVLVTLWWRAHRANSAGGASAETLGWVFLATALIVTITNKTLSPQYLLWLGGPIAALAVRAPANHAVRTFGRALLIAAVLTQLIYPIGYQGLTNHGALMPVWTFVLFARNALLVWLTWYAVRQVWRQTRAVKVPGGMDSTVSMGSTDGTVSMGSTDGTVSMGSTDGTDGTGGPNGTGGTAPDKAARDGS